MLLASLWMLSGCIVNWLESKSLTLQGADYAKTVEQLNPAIERAEGLLAS